MRIHTSALLPTALLAALLLAACGERSAPATEQSAGAADAPADDASTDVAAACAGEHARAVIGWNVEAEGVERVAVYLAGANGERLFAQGSPVGEKATGNWLRPGMVFKARAKDDGRELGSLEIAERQDCGTQ